MSPAQAYNTDQVPVDDASLARVHAILSSFPTPPTGDPVAVSAASDGATRVIGSAMKWCRQCGANPLLVSGCEPARTLPQAHRLPSSLPVLSDYEPRARSAMAVMSVRDVDSHPSIPTTWQPWFRTPLTLARALTQKFGRLSYAVKATEMPRWTCVGVPF